jgi:hypothetical protein
LNKGQELILMHSLGFANYWSGFMQSLVAAHNVLYVLSKGEVEGRGFRCANSRSY